MIKKIITPPARGLINLLKLIFFYGFKICDFASVYIEGIHEHGIDIKNATVSEIEAHYGISRREAYNIYKRNNKKYQKKHAKKDLDIYIYSEKKYYPPSPNFKIKAIA